MLMSFNVSNETRARLEYLGLHLGTMTEGMELAVEMAWLLGLSDSELEEHTGTVGRVEVASWIPGKSPNSCWRFAVQELHQGFLWLGDGQRDIPTTSTEEEAMIEFASRLRVNLIEYWRRRMAR